MGLNKLDYFKYLLLVYGLRRGTISISWSDPARVDLSEIGEKKGIGAYPLDFSRDDHGELLIDERGVPMIDYANLGMHHNPWFVGHIALGRYTRWLRNGREADREGFQRLVDWFVGNATLSQRGAYWPYRFDWFGHSSPWFSGLSQAHAISSLLRAAVLFGGCVYAELAREALRFMITPLAQGGTTTTHEDDSVCFQENCSERPSSILNGHLFCCISLWEASQFFGETEYENLTDKGFRFVRDRLDEYDLGYWSRYSLKRCTAGLPDIASPHYHDVHVAQFRVAYAITGDEAFRKAAERFHTYQRTPRCARKALWTKRVVKVLR